VKKSRSESQMPTSRDDLPHRNRSGSIQQPMLNALSVDVEDYFHVEAFAGTVAQESWDRYSPRVDQNVDRILEIFARYSTKATFFMLGWVAQKFPGMVRKISDAGHEIGCHGYSHQHLLRQTPHQFQLDIRTARQRLMDEIQMPIQSYRAPSFSIVHQTLWALDLLAEEGFRIDSSIFPIKHDLYGLPGSPRFPHWEKSIFEFPPSTIKYAKICMGVGGGGYLRHFPYRVTRWAISRINADELQPAMVYFHPWELDPDQPRIPAPLLSKLRHYSNLESMKEKVISLLKDFQFSTVSEVCRQLQVYSEGPSL
jgi:polysaccharide deacetylase family protein (PEP-CTERM system associated)